MSYAVPTIVKATCGQCGPFENLCSNVRAGAGMYETRCPWCGALVSDEVSEDTILQLIAAGSRPIAGPIELTPSGDWDIRELA
jgi:uncharacterized Zn finger protein